ncbi:MAG: glutamine--tRNA ligase, partial [Clostridia bacterium]|nr:glutamine--tRNA ligase [Clostridia bacterium]
ILYDRLFTEENMNDLPEGKTYMDYLNPTSADKLTGIKVEPALDAAAPGEKFQFVRIGYFAKDTKNPGTFNRIVSLKDSYKPE